MVFGSAAALGAGVAIEVDHARHPGVVPTLVAAGAVTVPVALYLVSVWWRHLRSHHQDRACVVIFPGAAVLVLTATFVPQPLLVTGVLLLGVLAASYRTAQVTA